MQRTQSTPNDATLLKGIANGDAEAAEVFFRRHYARVRALCARVVSVADADDLVQDTFIRVLRFAGSYRGQASASTWLYRIAHNACLDHLAHQRQQMIEPRDAEPPSEDPRLEILDRALRQLPEQFKTPLVLSRFHDLTHAQLGNVLGCSEGAARVRVHRALTELKRIVHELEARDDAGSYS